MASIWTPPARFKANGSTTGGSLNMSQVGAFTDYLVDYLKYFKTQVGYDLHALSPQNEPTITTEYNSCDYQPADLATVIKALAPKLTSNNLPTKILYADDIFGAFPSFLGTCLSEVNKDATAAAYPQILAGHYGGNEIASRGEYRSYGRAAFNTGKKAWNSEFGNGSDSWDGGAWDNVRNMYYMLSYNYSGIVYWLLGPHTNSGQAEESVMWSNTWGPKARAIQPFARSIRPGARRVKTTCSNTNIYTLAFFHPEKENFTVMLINNTGSQQSVSVTGNGIPSTYTKYITSPSQNYVQSGTAQLNQGIDLPVKGIVALISADGSYTGPTSEIDLRPAYTKSALLAPAMSNRSFGIDGRRAGARTSRGGVRLTLATDRNGASVARTEIAW